MPLELSHSAAGRSEMGEVVWRYISVEKLYDLLRTGELYFPSVTALRQTDDREGRLSAGVVRFLSEIDDQEVLRLFPELRGNAKAVDLHKAALKLYVEAIEAFCERTFVSCWHASPHENMLMWSSYAIAGSGLAIASSVGAIHEALAANESFVAGRVRYVSPRTHMTDFGNALNPIFEKHEAFGGEAEFRVAATRVLGAAPPKFVRVKVDVPKLLSEIVLKPFALDIEWQLVRHLLEMHGLADRLRRSELE